MSDPRGAPRPSMVNPYGAPIATMHVAETWRPAGWRGEVMVIVPERFEITETLRDGHNRVEFPVGTYLIPVAIDRKMRRLTPEGDYVEVDNTLAIGGVDESAMHWALRAKKVKHSSNQPHLHTMASPASAMAQQAIYAPRPDPEPEPGRFCSECGNLRSLGHDEDCKYYEPPSVAEPSPEPTERPVNSPASPPARAEEANRPPSLLPERPSERRRDPRHISDRR